MALLKLCTYPGCKATQKGRRCEKHADPGRHAYYRTRGTTTERGYGAAWRKVRRIVLLREPLCRMCAADGITARAVDVDHIRSKAQGGDDRFSNLQSLCTAHHREKSIKEEGGFGYRIIDGT